VDPRDWQRLVDAGCNMPLVPEGSDFIQGITPMQAYTSYCPEGTVVGPLRPELYNLVEGSAAQLYSQYDPFDFPTTTTHEPIYSAPDVATGPPGEDPFFIPEPIWAGSAGGADSTPTAADAAPPNVPVQLPMEAPVFEDIFPIQSGPDTFWGAITQLGTAALGYAFQDVPGQISQLPAPVMGPGNPVYQSSPISVGVGGACWSEDTNATTAQLKRRLLRRRVRWVRLPNGQLAMKQTCAPRHMNPLNPRALGRAARRLGSFQRIAAHTEKLIQRACKPKARRSYSRPSYGRSCGPKRCR